MSVSQKLAFALMLSLSAIANGAEQAIRSTYVQMAAAVFGDAAITTQALEKAVEALLASPSPDTLNQARDAWLQARTPYAYSESFRFANEEVDEWEGGVNAWPLDEGLIDYVADDYYYELGNIGAQLNIIANPVIKLGGQEIDARNITPELIRSMHEFGGSAANVASGYHAVEFLLWGQDLHGTNAGAGERPFTDFALGNECTHGNCDRRRAYLKAATALLASDMSDMAQRWQPGGSLYQAYQSLSNEQVIAKIFFSIGALSLGEVSGERMKVALEAGSTEDEQDCFSDNTHWEHYHDTLGMQNLYLGHYTRLDGTIVAGPSLAAAAEKRAPDANAVFRQAVEASVAATKAMVQAAEERNPPMKFDQMIADNNEEGRALVEAAIKALVNQTEELEALAQAMHVDSSSAVSF